MLDSSPVIATIKAMEPLKQSTLLSKMPDIPFTDDQRGKYVLHAEDDGHFMITLNGRVVDNNYHFTAQDIKSMGYSQGYPIKYVASSKCLRGTKASTNVDLVGYSSSLTGTSSQA